MAQSHNSGATWTQTKLVDSNRYYFDFDSDVDANGVVRFDDGGKVVDGPQEFTVAIGLLRVRLIAAARTMAMTGKRIGG